MGALLVAAALAGLITPPEPGDWRVLSLLPTEAVAFDNGSKRRMSDGTIRVWVARAYASNSEIFSLGGRHTLTLWRVDCDLDAIQWLTNYTYGDEASPLDSSTEGGRMIPAVPGTAGEIVLDVACERWIPPSDQSFASASDFATAFRSGIITPGSE